MIKQLRMKNIRTFGIMMAISIISAPVSAQSIPSLQEVIDSALVHDYNYANKKLALEQIELDQQKIKDAFLPRISLDAKEAYVYGATNLNIPELLIFPEYDNRYHLQGFMTQADLKASFLIFSGGKVSQMKKANAARLEAETAMSNLDRNEIIESVLMSYDQLALLKSVKIMLDDSQKRLEANQKQAEKALEIGLITQSDFNKINLTVAQLASKFQEYEGKRQLLLLNLHAMTKIDLARLELIDEDLKILPIAYVEKPVLRNELVALDAAVRANEYKIKAAKTWWIPKIGASASVSYMGLHDGKITSRDNMIAISKPLDHQFNNYNVAPLVMAGVGLKWDLFDGRTGINETKQAKLDLAMAMNKQADANDKISLQLKKNKLEAEIAQSQIDIKQTALSIAEDALQQANKEYELGLIKSTELIDAENALQKATLEYAQAVFTQRRVAIQYLEAAGTLESTFIK